MDLFNHRSTFRLVDGKSRAGNGAFRQTVDAAVRHNPTVSLNTLREQAMRYVQGC